MLYLAPSSPNSDPFLAIGAQPMLVSDQLFSKLAQRPA